MRGGTIYKEGRKWIWKSPPYKENGQVRRTRKSFSTEAEAEYQRKAFLAQTEDKDNNYISGLTVRQAFNFWRENEWRDEESISYSTQKNYISVYNVHILPIIGNEKIDNLKCSSFNAYLQKVVENRARKTAGNIRQALIVLLKYCKNMGLIDVSNENKLKLPDIRKGKRDREKIVNTISQTEYEKVYFHMDACESMYAEIIRFLRETGLRAEELAVKPADITGKALNVRRVIKRQPFEVKDKNGKISYKSRLVASNYMKSNAAYRSIPLTKDAMRAIKSFENWKKENNIVSDYIFCTKTGGLSEQRNILRAFHSACESVDIEKRGLHSLRKLFCKALKELPTDWETVRRVMGHESVEVTKRYYYALNEDDLESLADALSADQ